MLRIAIGILCWILPSAAGADYLYSVERNTGPKPYVIFLADNSGSMNRVDSTSDCCTGSRCGSRPRCATRIDLLKNTLTDVIPKLDNVGLGIMKYGVTVGRDSCGLQITNPLPTTTDGQPSSVASLLQSVSGMTDDSNTPIAQSLEEALKHLEEVRRADAGKTCRRYAVVMLTDGEPNCSRTGKPAVTAAYAAVDALRRADIPTYVIGFGQDVANSTFLTELARRGGTARLKGTNGEPDRWCQPINGTCSDGIALLATQGDELSKVLQETFEQIQTGQYSPVGPVISTVAQSRNEIDRVSRNFLAYSAFEQPGYRGHLYGIRLFEEDDERAGIWNFTNLEDMDLKRCGEEGHPCVFDAGAKLAERLSAGGVRRILSSVPAGDAVVSQEGGLTYRFTSAVEIQREQESQILLLLNQILEDGTLEPGISALPADEKERLEMASESTTEGRAMRIAIGDWLHGTSRDWPLGDIYHSAPAIVGPPPYQHRTRGYPVYKAALRRRADMIYVGANDGMIHAFYAGPDHFKEADKPARWTPGEEAWSYLPFNMVARASTAALAVPAEKRFFSQDLSCRVEDVLSVDNMAGGTLDCGSDPYCGWRTVLVCGQGWGGSWYVALDVTDPADPKPLWESTHGYVKDESFGLGRTWGVPSIAVLNMDRGEEKAPQPAWFSIYASGYNSDLRDADGASSPAYGLLNMPFAGAFPYHGDGSQGEHAHVFVQNLWTGEFAKVFHHHDLQAILADLPVVDLDHDSFSDTVYVGGWNEGRLDRIAFTSTEGVSKVSDWSNACRNFVNLGANNPVTSRPTAYANPMDSNHLYLFVGTGVDNGAGPDEHGNLASEFMFRAFHFLDEGKAECPRDPAKPKESVTVSSAGNICHSSVPLEDGTESFSFEGLFREGQRLLSAPVLITQRNQRKQLTFTSWRPTTGNACGEGVSALYCVDVSQPDRCLPCGNLAGSSTETEIELGGAKPTTPTSADGQVYTVGAGGLVRVGNQDGEGTGLDGISDQANVNAPRSMIISWRDIF